MQPAQLRRSENARCGKFYRLKPVLGQLVRMLDMDMGRLMTFLRVEEEAKSLHMQNGRHSASRYREA
jgi:hypothetical protein